MTVIIPNNRRPSKSTEKRKPDERETNTRDSISGLINLQGSFFFFFFFNWSDNLLQLLKPFAFFFYFFIMCIVPE
jgi:hypothetical protein